MTNKNQPSKRTNNSQVLLFAVCSVLVPLGALVWSGFSELVSSGSSDLKWSGLLELNPSYAVGLQDFVLAGAFPFGLSRIALAYLVCCLPLSWWTAGRVGLWIPENTKSIVKVFAALVGAGIGLVVMFDVSGDSRPLTSIQDGWALHIIRICWVFGLQLPWLVAAQLSAHAGHRKTAELTKGLVAVFMVLVAPLCYAESEVARQFQMFELFRKDGHLLDAWIVVKRLNDYGTMPLRAVPHLEDGSAGNPFDRFLLLRSRLPQVEKELQEMINARITFLGRPPPTDPNYGDRIARIQMFIALGKPFFADAERILKTDGLSDSDSLASSILGNIRYWQKDFSHAIQCFRNTVDLELSKPAPDKVLVVKAFNNLADSMRASEGNLAAEKMLKKAIVEFPDDGGALTYALATHYQSSGRPLAALEQFQKLVSTESDYAEAANQRIQQIKNDSTGCLIWP